MLMPDVWMFGDGSSEMGIVWVNWLFLVVKTATCSSLDIYKMEEEQLPKAGQYDIILDGQSQPLAIIRTTKVEIMPMNKVSESFAQAEGEGDLTLIIGMKSMRGSLKKNWPLSATILSRHVVSLPKF